MFERFKKQVPRELRDAQNELELHKTRFQNLDLIREIERLRVQLEFADENEKPGIKERLDALESQLSDIESARKEELGMN